MRIVIITQGVSRIVKPLLISDFDIVGIVESKSRNQVSPILKHINSLFPYIGRRKITLKKFSEINNIPYTVMNSGNNIEIEKWIRIRKADLIVVNGMSQLLQENIFSLPKYGAINLHPSFLPEYRGPNPDFWQYYDMILDPGVTIHFIDKGEDTGDIICQERIKVNIGVKSPDRLDYLVGEVGVRLLLKAIEEIEKGDVKTISQSKDSPTKRARNLRKEEHNTIIKWNEWSIERIWNILRGTESWLNAIKQPKGIYRGQRWIIGDYIKMKTTKNEIGQIKKTRHNYMLICDDGLIELSIKFSFRNLIKYILKI